MPDFLHPEILRLIRVTKIIVDVGNFSSSLFESSSFLQVRKKT